MRAPIKEALLWAKGNTMSEKSSVVERHAMVLAEELEDWLETHKNIINEPCLKNDDRQHCTCVPSLREEIDAMKLVIALVAPFIEYAVPHGSVCFGCDMGAAGPGPKGEHDPDCDIAKLIAGLKVFKARRGA